MPRLNIHKIALNDADRERGLMHTKPLPDGDCALFVFDRTNDYSFWNQNVSYPIDVAFFDDSARLVHVGKLQAHQTSPIKSGNRGVKYVVETASGWFEKNGVKSGSSLWDLIDMRRL